MINIYFIAVNQNKILFGLIFLIAFFMTKIWKLIGGLNFAQKSKLSLSFIYHLYYFVEHSIKNTFALI